MIEIRRATDLDVSTLVALNDTVQKMHVGEYPHILKYPADPAEITSFFAERIGEKTICSYWHMQRAEKLQDIFGLL